LLVDGVGGEMPRFQVHAIAHDNDAIERQTGLGTVPGDELIDGVLVDTPLGGRAEAVKHCSLAMIQIRQTKQPATVIRLDSILAHGDGLPMPQHWDYRRAPAQCNSWTLMAALTRQAI
jgi:hypothetical protein